MNEAPKKAESVGAPSAYAEAEEVPDWLANLLKAFSTIPLFLSVVVGFLSLCGGCWFGLYILSLFL